MGRLIDMTQVDNLPPSLAVRAGDILMFNGTGGHVRSGKAIVEILGTFISGLLASNGRVLSPAGAPNTLLFRATGLGHATIDIVTGDPWHHPRTSVIDITVEK